MLSAHFFILEKLVLGRDVAADPKRDRLWRDSIPRIGIGDHMRSYIRPCHFNERSALILDLLLLFAETHRDHGKR